MTTRVNAKLHNEDLKDAYRVWLKDLYDDKPERLLKRLDKKKKSGGGRRARRNQRMQHAQQHTAASALKDVALKKAEQAKLPSISLVHTPADKQALQESQSRRHQALVDEANYSAFQYSHQPTWRPGLAFFQQLVRQLLEKPSPECGNNYSEGVITAEMTGFPVLVAPILLRVPVCRQGTENHLGVALLFCQEQNQELQQVGASGDVISFVLRCRVYVRPSNWREHRNSLLDILSNVSNEICAVRKCAENFESQNNELQLLRSRQDVEKAIDELWVSSRDTEYDTDLLAIQKYIPFKGTSSRSNAFTAANMAPSVERKAWIARCASRKRDKNSSTVWIISGGEICGPLMAITNTSSADCQLVKCTVDQAWSEPRLLTTMCAMSLEKALRIRFNELVLDLLQDTFGTWWLLQVKAFTLASLRPASAATMSSLPTKTLPGLSRTQSAPTRFEIGVAPTPQWKKWRCAGRYCAKHSCKRFPEPENQQVNDLDGPDDDKEPCGYLTKKMLRSCEFYDDFIQQQDMSLAGGFAEFHSALTFHLQHRLPKRDRSQLYEPQPLCRACVKRYHSLRQQWIETVGVLKTMATIGGPRRKITQAKEHSEQTLLPSRKLPSLQRKPEALSALTCSYSSPALTASNPSNTTKLNKREDTTKQSNYLTELAAMEEMLAELEPPSLLKDKKHEHQNVAPVSSSAPLNALSTKPPRHEDIFPKWDGVTRIEEMWQNLTFKPLEKQLTKVGSNHSESGGVKQGYNSISLQQELAKVAKTGDNNENDKLTEPELKLYKEVDQSPGISLMKSVAACTVHVQHCRRVFEDESYREGLVNDAVSALRSGKPNVCLVVTPPPQNPHNKKHANEDGDELAEMALRSLYIDVKQVIAASSDGLATELLLSSWPMRPTVWRETSGCITVNLGPA
ncbi:hypothetical protein PC110_g533 [Phytophthora cactorum]|uniref:Uncharacterized protein n=2 Tax=Phytophthora cactorum TaxID=29920 RepID=A0A329T3M6_9STRA|nr:hypothetical protein PC114_g4764 [Phytophthora cactorum]RAW43301.1 hypothetical protein PC110_g533 [Phytophthora cactorum]